RLYGRDAPDPAHVVQAVRDPADELADGRADARERSLLRAHRRSAVPPVGHTPPQLVHDRDRSAAADGSARPPAPGAILVRHRSQGLRAALAGGGLAGAERDRGGVGGDGSTGPRRTGARPRPPARARPAAGRPGLLAPLAGRLAVRAGRAAREAQAVRRGHAVAAG